MAEVMLVWLCALCGGAAALVVVGLIVAANWLCGKESWGR